MAKVFAPLLSFSASGKLANAVVHFPWKGINAVREYVIPANPQTKPQTDQRNRLGAAVDEWHGALYTADDVTAWNRYAGILEKIMSGFNAMVRTHVKEALLTNVWTRMAGVSASDVGTTIFTARVHKVSGGIAPTVYWGTRKTRFPDSKEMSDVGNDTWFADITGLTKDTLYYFYIDVGVSGETYGRVGIYQQRTLA